MAELTVEAYRKLVYSKAWQAWQRPGDPRVDRSGRAQILDKHLGTPTESKTA